MKTAIVIDAHFNGPPQMGNGGYVCGTLYEHLSITPEIRLQRPIPLDTPLILESTSTGFELKHKNSIIASIRKSQLNLSPPLPLHYDEALTASQHYIGLHHQHLFPTCFVCGTGRPNDAGLHLQTGRHRATELFAAPWVPHSRYANTQGEINVPFIVAALDCPGAFAVMGDQMCTMVLGSMTPKIFLPVQANENCVVMAWHIHSEGKKHYAGTALYNEQQQLCAMAYSVWIELKPKVS